MSDLFNALLIDLGRRIGLDELSADGDGECVLEIGGLDLTLREQEAGGVLIHASAGTLAAGAGRERQMARLLGGNYFFWETGGATLAADPVTGDIQLQYRQAVDGMDGGALYTLLANFLDRLEYWRAACMPEEPASPPGDQAIPPGGIQV